jgi:hypothetical protein
MKDGLRLAAAPLLRGDRRRGERGGDSPSARSIRGAGAIRRSRARRPRPHAEHAGSIYLDLADEHWRAVEIGADGWRMNKFPPVRFRRPTGLLPLPAPERGGLIEDLLPFLNLSSRNDFVSVVAWLLAALRPGGPYPLLTISGEQGSAKTILSRMLKALVDPNMAPVRALPREERDPMIVTMGICWHLITSRPCPPGSRMRSVGSRAGEVSRCDSSIPTTRCYSKRRARCS